MPHVIFLFYHIRIKPKQIKIIKKQNKTHNLKIEKVNAAEMDGALSRRKRVVFTAETRT